ncbi:MAG: diheme cytochrome c [Pseudolabrys sp.]
MRIPRLPFPVWPLGAALAVAGTVFAVGVFTGAGANAEDGEGMGLRPVTDKTVQAECGACHMAFPPGLLPARSWRAIMGKLDDHFGENAALDDETAKRITDYLVANAADSGNGNRRVLRGVRTNDTPLRITELPWWVREHSREVRPGAFKDPRVKSKANCGACHRGAAGGYFEDD